MIAGHPETHQGGHYRCSLPGLAGFVILGCTGPDYQKKDADNIDVLYTVWKQPSRLFEDIFCIQGNPVILSGITGFSKHLAERVRFELTVLAYTRFPSVRLKPLGHLSVIFSVTESVPFYTENIK